MDIPKPPPVQTDPMLLQQQEKASRDQVLALQDQARSDTSSFMARFGSLAAMLQAAKG